MPRIEAGSIDLPDYEFDLPSFQGHLVVKQSDYEQNQAFKDSEVSLDILQGFQKSALESFPNLIIVSSFTRHKAMTTASELVIDSMAAPTGPVGGILNISNEKQRGELWEAITKKTSQITEPYLIYRTDLDCFEKYANRTWTKAAIG